MTEQEEFEFRARLEAELAQAEQQAQPSEEPNTMGEAGALALGAAQALYPYAVPAATIGAGLYGASKVGGWARNITDAAREIAAAQDRRTQFEIDRDAKIRANQQRQWEAKQAAREAAQQPRAVRSPGATPRPSGLPPRPPTQGGFITPGFLGAVSRVAGPLGLLLEPSAAGAGEMEELERYRRLAQQQMGQPIEARQFGGPIAPNKPYLVGEAGPEIIVPQLPGMVLPNPATLGEIQPVDYSLTAGRQPLRLPAIDPTPEAIAAAQQPQPQQQLTDPKDPGWDKLGQGDFSGFLKDRLMTPRRTAILKLLGLPI